MKNELKYYWSIATLELIKKYIKDLGINTDLLSEMQVMIADKLRTNAVPLSDSERDAIEDRLNVCASVPTLSEAGWGRKARQKEDSMSSFC